MTKDPKILSTVRGHPLTDADIQAMADEAERGYDPAKMRPRGGRPPMGSAAATVVPVRLDPELLNAVEARAAADHTTTSDVIRAALRNYVEVA